MKLKCNKMHTKEMITADTSSSVEDETIENESKISDEL
jgi:hypothetical protein